MTNANSTAAAKSRCVLAQFCDDIRYEIGNKITLVGIYNTTLFLPEFPALIPHLGVNLIIDLPIDEEIKTLVLRIEKGDEIILESTTPLPSPSFLSGAMLDGHDEITRALIGMQLSLPPITVMSSCMLRVKVTLDGVECVAGKLRISAAPSNQSTAPV